MILRNIDIWNMEKNNKVLLFTFSFPYGNSETFIENEIIHLSKSFDKVYIFPFTKSETKREIPNNVEVVDLFENFIYYRNEVLKKYILLYTKVISQEFTVGNLFNKEYKNTISRLLQLFSKSYVLEKWIIENKITNSIYYSYWLEDWATILSILKNRKKINSFISRAHGFDLYEERSDIKVIPFRRLQLEQVDKVFLISEHGLRYLSDKYPRYSYKFKLSYLGTVDHGISKYKSTSELRILTVSNVVPVKRLHLLIESLNIVNKKVNWTHFGDGLLMGDILAELKKLPENVTTDFKGRISNTKMLTLIKDNHFDVFINVSGSEGIPVSIMEAISFEIPIFATDVGGTREIVNEQTGKLFSYNLNIDNLSESINNFKNSKYSTKEFRKGVREYWKYNFDATSNYRSFVEELKNEK